jgi:hypothetical protein
MARLPFSCAQEAAVIHRMNLPSYSEPVQPAGRDWSGLPPVTRSRQSWFSYFLEELFEAVADSSVQPAGLGPRGLRGRSGGTTGPARPQLDPRFGR